MASNDVEVLSRQFGNMQQAVLQGLRRFEQQLAATENEVREQRAALEECRANVQKLAEVVEINQDRIGSVEKEAKDALAYARRTKKATKEAPKREAEA